MYQKLKNRFVRLTSSFKIFLWSIIFISLISNTAVSQNYEKIQWLTDEEISQYSTEDVAEIIEGKWFYVYKNCPWSDLETTRDEGRAIEFTKEKSAFLWYKNAKTGDEYSWKIKETSKGWFIFELKTEKAGESLGLPFQLGGRFMISKDLKYIYFSNDIEIDAGCLYCFERSAEK
jgi:hypothetical protein